MKRESFADAVKRELPLFEVEMKYEHAGRRSAAIGADFENMILASNMGYQRKGLGVVKKNFAKTMFARGQMHYVAKGTVDYDGFLDEIGFVAFDAKSCDGPIWHPKKDDIHQFLYLLKGQRLMPFGKARFFYLIQTRVTDDRNGSLRVVRRTYLAENLELIAETGRYEPRDEDEIFAGHIILLDYRKRLLNFIP